MGLTNMAILSESELNEKKRYNSFKKCKWL